MAEQSVEWQAESQRITLFLEASSKPPAADEVWHKLTGLQAEEMTSKPTLGLQRASGTFVNSTFLVQVNPARIDFVLTPISKDEPVDSPPTLGAHDSFIGLLTDSLGKWITQAPPVVRIAYGVSALRAVGSKRDGYLLLDELLPAVDLDVDNSSDFLYQINRPRDSSALPGLPINRLNKWSVQRMMFATGTVGANLELKFVGSPTNELNICKAELDLNTHADRVDILPNEVLMALFVELFTMSQEILAKGDIP